jgi:hypothetical protein
MESRGNEAQDGEASGQVEAAGAMIAGSGWPRERLTLLSIAPALSAAVATLLVVSWVWASHGTVAAQNMIRICAHLGVPWLACSLLMFCAVRIATARQ